MAEEHDSWLEGLGVDVNNFVSGISNAASPLLNPDSNPHATVFDQAAGIATSFAKGVTGAAMGVAQGAGAMTNPFGALANVTAAAAGAPGADKALLPDMNPDLSAKAQQQAVARANATIGVVENPIGSAAETGVKIANSDHPGELIAEGLGRGLVIAGASLAGAGEVGLGEAGVGETAAADDAASASASAEDPAFAQTQAGPTPTVNDPALAAPPARGVAPTLDGVPPTVDGVPPTVDEIPPTVDDPVLAQASPSQRSAGAVSVSGPGLPEPAAAPNVPRPLPNADASAAVESGADKESPLAASVPDP